MAGSASKTDVRRALAVALARAHEDVVTAKLSLPELAELAVLRGVPASPDLLEDEHGAAEAA